MRSILFGGGCQFARSRRTGSTDRARLANAGDHFQICQNPNFSHDWCPPPNPPQTVEPCGAISLLDWIVGKFGELSTRGQISGLNAVLILLVHLILMQLGM